MMYVINGLFLTKQVTGIQRYALEICKELDKLVSQKRLSVLVPECYEPEREIFQNIRVVKYGKLRGILWEQIELREYARRHHARCVNFCNVTPTGTLPGITVIHDIMFKLYPEWFTSMRNRLSRMWHIFQADYAVKHERLIIAPSDYTRRVLEKYYPQAKGRIAVIPPAWQHMKEIKPDHRWRDAYPFLEPGSYYFSLSTRSGNKNGKWIFKAAENHPDSVFAIAGRCYEPEGKQIPSNVHFLGYVSDEDICALMKNCKAFIFPSYCEGFGMPPMEALALGAEVIVSDAPALPEIYGNSVHYIHPERADTDLDSLLEEKVNAAEDVLDRYSWSGSAEKLYRLMYPRNGKQINE